MFFPAFGNIALLFSLTAQPLLTSRSTTNANEGDYVELYLTAEAKIWKRVRMDDDRIEFIKYCVNGQHSHYCSHFVCEVDGKLAEPLTEGWILSNGTLVIPSVQKSDEGFYVAMEGPEKISVNDNGESMWGIARNHIVLTVN